uniref:Cesa7 n=1 Tax=Arundo donax TaxID=35708 RepID=A0A0A9F4T0_ARUDO
MVFKDPFMWVLDASLDGRHFMVTMLPKQRSPRQEPATAGPSGVCVAAAVTGIRRQQNRSWRRRRDYFSRKQKIHLLHMLWVKLRKVFQELKMRRLEL